MNLLILTYLSGAMIYGLLQLLTGNAEGYARVTIKWWTPHRVVYIPAAIGVVFMTALWFIVLPTQVYQYNAEQERYRRNRISEREGL